MKILLTVLAAAGAAVLAAPADEASPHQLLVAGNDQFTAKLFSEVVRARPAQSVVVSAFSALPPLAQLALASDGASRDELRAAIGLRDDDTIKAAFSGVTKQLRDIKGVALHLASRLYVPPGGAPQPAFAQLARDVFQSDVKNVDFEKNVQAAGEINAWVEEQTNHRIKDLVDPDSIGAATRALLVNALYFKGNWSQKFSPQMTSDQDFHVNKETTIKVPTMYQKGSFKYGESQELNAKLLEMSYEGNEASFLVVLPNEVDGLAALEEKLRDPAALPAAARDMYSTTVEVHLPKFIIETTTNLKDVLEKIGIKKLFTAGQARLDRLLQGARDLHVSDAVQKAFIELTEEGAEAAAANAFGVVFTSALVEPPAAQFRADRPFVFALRTRDTVLFNGVYHPGQPDN